MKGLILFPFKWFRSGTGCLDRILSFLVFVVVSPALCLCGAFMIILATGDSTSDVDNKLAQRQAQTETAIFLLTNSPTPSDTPTDTYTPTNTHTPSDTPTATNTKPPTPTRTPSPAPTTEQLASDLEEIAGTVYLRSSTVEDRNNDGSVIAYFEIDVREGYNTQSFADAVYQIAYQEAIVRFGSGNIDTLDFSVVLWDGSGDAISWRWDNGDDTWDTTDMGITPEGNPMTRTPTPMPSPVVEKFDKTLYATGQTVNIRGCASTQCAVLGTLALGESVKATGVYNGEWYRFTYKNSDGWLHESVVSTSRPSTSAPRATSAPRNTSAPQATIPPGSGATCNGATTCGQMASCEQAYACLRAGDGGLDADDDGVPCESICPGG